MNKVAFVLFFPMVYFLMVNGEEFNIDNIEFSTENYDNGQNQCLSHINNLRREIRSVLNYNHANDANTEMSYTTDNLESSTDSFDNIPNQNIQKCSCHPE